MSKIGVVQQMDAPLLSLYPVILSLGLMVRPGFIGSSIIVNRGRSNFKSINQRQNRIEPCSRQKEYNYERILSVKVLTFLACEHPGSGEP